MDLRKFHANIFIMVIIFPGATIGWEREAHVYMTNNLGPDSDRKQIPYNWTCQWWFNLFYPGILQCDANILMPQFPDVILLLLLLF